MYGEGLYGNRFPDDPAWPILLLLGRKENVSESQSPVKRVFFPNAWFVVLCVHAQAHTHTRRWVCILPWSHHEPQHLCWLQLHVYGPAHRFPFLQPSRRDCPLLDQRCLMQPRSWVQEVFFFCFFFLHTSIPVWGEASKSRSIYSTGTQRYSLYSKVDRNALSGTLLSTHRLPPQPPAPGPCLNYKATPSKTQRPRCWDEAKWLFSKSAREASEIVRDAYSL